MGESLKVADKVILGNNNYAPPIVKPNGSRDPIQVFTGFKGKDDNSLPQFSTNRTNNSPAQEISKPAPRPNIEELKKDMYAKQRYTNSLNSTIKDIEKQLSQQDNPLSPKEKSLLEERLKNLKKEHLKAKEAFFEAWKQTQRAMSIQKRYKTPPSIKEANGKIEDFRQGYTGDCWLLASLKALSKSPHGAKVLKKIIQKNNDGSVTINLLGANKEYRFTQKDIDKRFAQSQDKTNRNFLSTGDIDVFLIEMAVEKEIGEIHGDYQERAMKILTGKNTTTIKVTTGNVFNRGNNTSDPNRKMWNLLDYALENPKNLIMTFDTPDKKITGSSLVQRHAYTIDTEKSTPDNIVLINPHDTSKRINVPKDKIAQWGDDITITDLRDYENYEIPYGTHLWGIRKTFKLNSIKSLIIANPELINIENVRDGKTIRIPKEE